MNGLVIGTVTQNYDEKHPGMVRVSYPSFSSEEKVTAWMPVASVYAGKDYGLYFHPEKDEQVIVGFIEGDAHCGVVLGSLWNAKNTIPADTVCKDNLTRRISTKGGHSVVFKDGDEGMVTLKSKNGHIIEIDEKNKKISVVCGGKQKIVLDEENEKIDIEASKNVNIKAEAVTVNGKIVLKGQSVAIEADNDVVIKGKQIKIEGSTAKINGQSAEMTGANVKVESSGILTLKGSMAKIN
jgi:uncharacterized protein involved in type VI secretion and phage assembly